MGKFKKLQKKIQELTDTHTHLLNSATKWGDWEESKLDILTQLQEFASDLESPKKSKKKILDEPGDEYAPNTDHELFDGWIFTYSISK